MYPEIKPGRTQINEKMFLCPQGGVECTSISLLHPTPDEVIEHVTHQSVLQGPETTCCSRVAVYQIVRLTPEQQLETHTNKRMWWNH